MALNVLPVRVEVPVLTLIFTELKRSTGNAMVRAAARVRLQVIALHAVDSGAVTRKVSGVEGQRRCPTKNHK